MIPGIIAVMEMDDDACYRAIETRDRRFDGLLFIAVTTTGIYCRPFCPAPTPRRKNARFYQTAAAAQEAGFRPCLRCRPEISPDLAFWRGSSNTVSRALGLIEAGGLDGADVETLAERLGVSGRQLRRLFQKHLGASPISIAQTRRILLAKQLIQDTSLPMTEVAAAAGFGSIRRFNETFQQLFRRPPNALRRSGAKSGETAMGEVTVRLGYRPPYDWDSMASFLSTQAVPGVEMVSSSRYARTIAIDGERGMLVVEPAAGGCFRVTVHLSSLKVLSAVIARVRRVFDLAADPVLIDTHLGQDPVLAPLIATRPGLRIPGAWNGFELAVRTILGQCGPPEAAAKLAGRLASSIGERISNTVALDQGLTHLFPKPRQLAGADLTAFAVPKGVRMALSSLAAAVITDPLIFSPRRSLKDAIAQMRSLGGLDASTAEYIAMRELREPDAFPITNIGLVRSASGRLPSPAKLLAYAERWRPWRAYAALHLWAAGPNPIGEVHDDRGIARTPSAGPTGYTDRGSTYSDGRGRPSPSL